MSLKVRQGGKAHFIATLYFSVILGMKYVSGQQINLSEFMPEPSSRMMTACPANADHHSCAGIDELLLGLTLNKNTTESP